MFYRKDPKDQQREIDRKPTEEEIRYGAKPTCFGVHERLSISCDETSCQSTPGRKYSSKEDDEEKRF